MELRTVINVDNVLRDVPEFETFCSVKKLHDLAEVFRDDPRFDVQIAGSSPNGIPIYHVRFGKGSIKALILTGPHANEPNGSLATFSLMSLLQQGHPELVEANVEWHIVPCIEPDGAILNEGWTQKPFTLGNYMRQSHVLTPPDVDAGMPVNYKRWVFDQPRLEARILKNLLDQIRPDFFYSQHNCYAGGGWCLFSRDVGEKYYQAFYGLLEQHHMPLQRRTHSHEEIYPPLAEGVLKCGSIKRLYDFLEKSTPFPEKTDSLQGFGDLSWAYLTEIKPSALAFVSELPHVKHPRDGSQKETGQNMRQLRLRMDAENKFLATVILEEWEKVKNDLESTSPFYGNIRTQGLEVVKERLCEQGPWQRSTRDTLFNPSYGRTMTEGDRLNVYLFDRFNCLRGNYDFVRLLKTSKQTPAVQRAIERLDTLFDEALDDLGKHIDLEAFEAIDCTTIAKVQLGMGLIALNAVLESHSATADVA